jgi:hypothetical protein
MLGLPKSTEVHKLLPKKAVFDKFKPNAADRKLFDEQISRLAIVAEISPQTIALSAGEDVSAVYVVLVTLKTAACDNRNIALLAKLIDQRMLFVLQHENTAQLAVHRAGKIFISESKPTDEWALHLRGFNLGAVWEDIVAQIGGIDLSGGKGLDETIAENDRREKQTKQIAMLEEKAMREKQSRRKWNLVEKAKQLRKQL